MGYTHYWTVKKSIDAGKFKKLSADCKMIVARSSVTIVNGMGEGETKPIVNSESVTFNGEAEQSHETFDFGTDSSGFDFCKTARKDYDEVVVACLMRIRHYFPESVVDISSDAQNLNDIKEGVALYKEVFGQKELPRYVFGICIFKAGKLNFEGEK